MEEQDIYIVDTRNADHRTQQGIFPMRPGTSARTMVAQPTRVYGPPAQSAQPQIIYAVPPQTTASHLLSKFNGPVLVDLIAQVFAALMPLPAAPVATADAPTDVGNLILYQSALATYAKRDEQVRTLGNLVTKLLG